MTRRILVIEGHPDPASQRFGNALAAAYVAAARSAGHTVEVVKVADLDFPVLRTRDEWETGALPPALLPVRDAVLRAEHLVLFFPLWLGGMPALLKGFLEQLARPGVAFSREAGQLMPHKLWSGRSARVVVTMGMPAAVYRWFFRAHSLKALERNILGFVGIAPVHETLIGMVEGEPAHRDAALRKIQKLGREGA
jgi:putative NADPH-quinone reductase